MNSLDFLKKQKKELVDFVTFNEVPYSEYELLASLNAKLDKQIKELESKN
jgi:hypothetical protein